MELITLKEGTDNIAEVFLIGTKPTIKQIDGSQFQIPDPKDLERAVRKANNIKGKGFIIDVEKLAARKNAHFFPSPRTFENLVKGYLDPVRNHGIFTGDINGPFSYNDGTNDIYFTADLALNHDRAAAVLLEHGDKASIPFAVSPHIWPTVGEGMKIVDFDFVGSALVDKGAYGPGAVVSKLCKGPTMECIAHFRPKDQAASSELCNCDRCKGEAVVLDKIINSFVSYAASNNLMSDPGKDLNTIPPGGSGQGQGQPETPAQATQLTPEPSGSVVKLTKEQYEQFEQFKKDSEDKARLQSEVEALKLESKTNALNRMFPNDLIVDANARQVLLDKYSKLEVKDIKGLESFLNDYHETILPLKLEQAKKQWEAENNTNNNNTNKDNTNQNDTSGKKTGKDRAAASDLREEPTRDKGKDKDEAASDTKPINKVANFSNLIRGKRV